MDDPVVRAAVVIVATAVIYLFLSAVFGSQLGMVEKLIIAVVLALLLRVALGRLR